MLKTVRDDLLKELDDIRAAGSYKEERILESKQAALIQTNSESVYNFCSNNYLGLSSDPLVIQAAQRALDEWGFGLSSVRFICGTQTLHADLEARMSEFLGTEDTILYSSCFDANGGLFETMLDTRDVVISDALNHASIIDGIRLSKARRLRYRNRDMAELQACLEDTADARRRLIVTDGVFSMDGSVAPLPEICDLAERYGAMTMVDDSHAVGLVGPNGRGTPEATGVAGRVDILTGTFGKALGGASGGYVSGPREVVALLRQRSRPYLFSNTLAPSVVGGTLAAIDLLERGGSSLRRRLDANAALFRSLMEEAAFDLLPGSHPIVAVMIGDAAVASRLADELLNLGIYVTAFSFPVVPRNQARIRVQLSAAHSPRDVERCVRAFIQARQRIRGADLDGQELTSSTTLPAAGSSGTGGCP